MEICEVSPVEYKNIINRPYHIFGSAAFNELNKKKCDNVYYLLFKDTKYRLGLIAGSRNNELISPFSAPFGGFVFLSSDIRLQTIEESIDLLIRWAKERKFTSIKITLPPSIYGESFIAKQSNCLFRNGFEIAKLDLNYAFKLADFDENYINSIWYNARKNLRIALASELAFTLCKTASEKKEAYEIIRKNRKIRGFPLRLTWEDVEETIQIIPADFFVVKNNQNISIASAIVFRITESVVQVIYWGDIPEFSKYKTMNFLSFNIFEHYKKSGLKIVDIGPSTENSIPNYGLCEFKESIGCSIAAKVTFSNLLT